MIARVSIPGARRVKKIGDNLLILGDTQKVMKGLQGRFDVIVSDPPYGINYKPATTKSALWRDVKGIVGDDQPFDPAHMLDAKVPTVLFGANNFASKLPDSRGWLVWDKRPGMRPMCFSDCEIAWSSLSKPARMIRYAWSGAYRGPETKDPHWHPTQKPIEVMRQLIEYASRPGQTILDPYMGSGTTGVAALRSGRKFIGIEIEERWFMNAVRRIVCELQR